MEFARLAEPLPEVSAFPDNEEDREMEEFFAARMAAKVHFSLTVSDESPLLSSPAEETMLVGGHRLTSLLVQEALFAYIRAGEGAAWREVGKVCGQSMVRERDGRLRAEGARTVYFTVHAAAVPLCTEGESEGNERARRVLWVQATKDCTSAQEHLPSLCLALCEREGVAVKEVILLQADSLQGSSYREEEETDCESNTLSVAGALAGKCLSDCLFLSASLSAVPALHVLKQTLLEGAPQAFMQYCGEREIPFSCFFLPFFVNDLSATRAAVDRLFSVFAQAPLVKRTQEDEHVRVERVKLSLVKQFDRWKRLSLASCSNLYM